MIGGDGSFPALNQFYADFKTPFAGIPATIDSIRDTASSFSRAFVVEVMGRHLRRADHRAGRGCEIQDSPGAA